MALTIYGYPVKDAINRSHAFIQYFLILHALKPLNLQFNEKSEVEPFIYCHNRSIGLGSGLYGGINNSFTFSGTFNALALCV